MIWGKGREIGQKGKENNIHQRGQPQKRYAQDLNSAQLVIADGLVVDGQRLGYLTVGETIEVGHFKDLAAAAGEFFNFFIDGFQHQRFYIVRQLAVLGLPEEGMEEILLPKLAPLNMAEEIQACIAARDIKKRFYILDTIEVGAQAPQLDKDVGRNVLGVFALGNKSFYKVV